MHIKKATHHLKHYTPLLGILGAAFAGFWIFSYDRLFQTALLIAVAIAYVSWGVIHHHIHKDLSLNIFLEYFVVAILGVVLVLTVIFRA